MKKKKMLRLLRDKEWEMTELRHKVTLKDAERAEMRAEVNRLIILINDLKLQLINIRKGTDGAVLLEETDD